VSASISPASVKDLWEIDRIERNAFPTPWSMELLRAAVLSKRYEVRVLRNSLAPVLGFSITHGSGEQCNLDNLAVDQPLRGQGFGSVLIRDWIERARTRQSAALTLQVNTANDAAQRLYQAFDFKTTRLLTGYYPNGDDAYQMEMALRPVQVFLNTM